MKRPNSLEMQALEERALMAWPGVAPTAIIPGAAVPIGITSAQLSVTRPAVISAAEVDLYTFTAPTSGNYTFDATTQLSDLNTVMALYDRDGQRINQNDDVGGQNTDSQFSSFVTAGSKYYLAITNKTGSLLGKYNWKITTSGPDDAYENNDTAALAKNLGVIKTTKTVSNLVMKDTADWFRFSYTGLAGAGSSVSINFTHALGDIDLQLFDSKGNLIRSSTGTVNSETVSLDTLVGSTFFVKAFGYEGEINPSYNLSVNLFTTPIVAGSRSLYLNFDGATISRAALTRYADGWGDPGYADLFDSDANGIKISRFLNGRTDREQIITRLIQHVQEDVRQYGIKVYRHRGSAIVENKQATTIFFGPSTLSNGFFHVACDIDDNNNNKTDIAFVGDEDWGSTADTALALADVALHEAGHTWGLWHVSSGTDNESMGLRYNTPEASWLQDTTFKDVLYNQYSNHGPSPQNSFQKMRTNFGLTSAFSAPTFTMNTSQPGQMAIRTMGSNDVVEIERIDPRTVEIRVNDRVYRAIDGLDKIIVNTGGDSRDRVKILNDLGAVDVQIDTPETLFDAKLDVEVSDAWRGLVAAHEEPGSPCTCLACARAFYPIA
jgi:hypothetical protein